MDDYLLNMLFAEDLVISFKNNGPSQWQFTKNVGKFRNRLEKSPFTEDIEHAVKKISSVYLSLIKAILAELYKENVNHRNTFQTYAFNVAAMYFPEGYTHGSFLGYCAVLCGIAFYFFAYPDSGIPESVAEVLALVLFSHQLTGQFEIQGGWGGLQKISKQLNSCLKEQDQQ